MLSKEEIEKARSNLLRGNDIESACLIMEEVIWNGLVTTSGRVNITKVAMRQILNFIEEYKNKGYLDVVKEKVQLKEKNNQLEKENKKQDKIIDEMIKVIIDNSICDYFIKDNCKYYAGENKKLCDECIKQYFEEKVDRKANDD